ncbi:TEPSIN [Branchiostoma lanceolatum]|uniref:TEPSIN protein n=1 Tax=Branchiostoma lanceolatum TaxID=7740 RepID=A0A8K0AC72_BRALA|nr:TEPSIN [Branchiostoma lanceolatum]
MRVDYSKMAAASGVVSGFVEKVTFVGKLPTLVKATSDDESPTPGYLYQEINAMLHESSSQCQQVLDYLVDRLNKDSFHVKLKVLRVMKHLIENGPSEFQQGLRRRAEGIKAATSYSGPPDPLHGHAPYVVVRKTATEVSSILFNTENCERSPNRPVSSNNRPNVPTGIGNLQTSPGRMQGFGNTVAQNTNKSLSTTILSNLKGWTEGVSGSNDNQYQPIGGQPLHPHSSGAVVGGYKPAMIDSSVGQPGMQYSPQVSPQRKTYHTAGKAGGGWEDSTSKRLHGNNTHSKSDNSGDSTELSERLETVSVEDRTQETQLVTDYTSCLGQAQSTRPPSREELQQFVKRCSALNCDVILQLLNDKLSHSDPQVQLKILFVLEHLMKTDLVTTEQLVELFRPTLETLSTGGQGACQAKATKILRQLTFQPPPPPAAQKTEEILQSTTLDTRRKVEASERSNFQTSLFSGMKLQTGVGKQLVNIETNTSGKKAVTQTLLDNQDEQHTQNNLQEGSQPRTSSSTGNKSSHLQDLLFLDVSDQSGRTEGKSQQNNNVPPLNTVQENTDVQEPYRELGMEGNSSEVLHGGSGVLKEHLTSGRSVEGPPSQPARVPQMEQREEEATVSNFTFLDRTLPGEKRNNLNQNGTVGNTEVAGKASGWEQDRSAPLSKKKKAAGRNADPFNFVQDAMQACKK